MKNNSQSPSPIVELAACELTSVVGGAGRVDFNSIRQQAQQHCPQTAQRYANVDPSTVTRSKAEKMGESCLAEMGSFKASFARPVIENAINSAFPQR